MGIIKNIWNKVSGLFRKKETLQPIQTRDTSKDQYIQMPLEKPKQIPRPTYKPKIDRPKYKAEPIPPVREPERTAYRASTGRQYTKQAYKTQRDTDFISPLLVKTVPIADIGEFSNQTRWGDYYAKLLDGKASAKITEDVIFRRQTREKIIRDRLALNIMISFRWKSSNQLDTETFGVQGILLEDLPSVKSLYRFMHDPNQGPLDSFMVKLQQEFARIGGTMEWGPARGHDSPIVIENIQVSASFA